MHIVIATPYLPWPLTEGGRVAQYHTLVALNREVDFTLVVPIHNIEQEVDAELFAQQFPLIRLDPVRCYDLPPTNVSVRDRIRRRIEQINNTIIPLKKNEKNHDYVVKKSPSYPFAAHHPRYIDAIDQHYNKGCDIFQAEFANMLTFGPFVKGKAPSIFVHHQLHFIYAQRYLLANNIDSSYARFQTARMIEEESCYLKSFNAAIVFSEVDQHLLKEFSPKLDVYVSPFATPSTPLEIIRPPESKILRFVFVASEEHEPNVEGLKWFMQEAWPILKKNVFDAKIEVIGKWSERSITSIPHYHDINFKGFVEKLGQSLQNSIMIVPVWVGSGIRTKILAAWSAGAPVVTTSIGAEGLPGRAGHHFLIADDPGDFARRCTEISQDKNLYYHVAINGLNLVKDKYSQEAVRKNRMEIYHHILKNNKSVGS
jgi:glycosyltransferase involved in cell wall biosynthesis